MRRFLVTGGAGFIGAHLVRALVTRGEAVRVLDNFSTGSVHNLAYALGRPVQEPPDAALVQLDGVEVLRGDIRDPQTCARACAGVDVVLHQAAMRSVPRSVDDPRGANEHNVTGTLNLLVAASAAGVRRFVYASSSSVYGDDPALPKREDTPPAPISPYAASKLAGEHYCRVFARTFGLATVALRYFNVFGPLQDPQSQYAAVIPRFIAWTLDGQPLEIHGDGEQSRDFTYVDNVVAANLLAADGPALDGEPINVACGERYTLLQVAEVIEGLLGRRSEHRHTPPRRGDVRHTLADIGRARARLGYTPRVGFHEGMARTVEFFVATAAGRPS
ncbi:MAG: SDR family oxidoreductase [Armatimonadota bacterium]|nr:SDR family oxidoreductase [Armatimonadota bacterium]MDR7454352.1 SDR family oxidoreductase [Armatimonadota bacterium]MDR7455976.1 SDR family oxidoreductase [Armatimonadota bacterium]MDR7496153.1 SDR family oxidoreductase [Armatimonadota bacterium]MDR7511354.1 SDR family oxidoreductase [Armatimonadota bacterium]